MRPTTCALLMLWAASAMGLAAQEPPGPALSPRNASYTIEVTLDAEAKTLSGTQLLSWRNIQQQPTDELWFHLYWNAWRNDHSTWMLENRHRGRARQRDVRENDWGWIEIDSIRLPDSDGGENVDLTDAAHFAAPDDGNPDDRTVLVVPLPRQVAPGETVELEMTWHSKIPRTFARTGYRGNFFFLAHWFPKLGVYEADGWNCHQYHAATEYYSDYGVYDVSMTVPDHFVLGSTGKQTERRDNADGTSTHRYYQEDVHAFTWTVSPDYAVREERFEEPGLPPVDMRLLYQPEHRSQVARHFRATREALKHYGTWYGPYPYDHVTVVDPAWGSGAGGMEYPTLFTCGTRLFNPPGGDSPEGVTIHEAGHQFWYGVVGNNEFEHAWIDEGLNTFSTLRTQEQAYGPRVLVRRYLSYPGSDAKIFALRFPEIEVPRWARRQSRYRDNATADDPHTPTFRYFPRSASAITYDKTALWLMTLERHLGWDVLQPIMSAFYERYKFKHPTPEDFISVANEIAGQDLGWFFDQVFHDSVEFDYAIQSVKSHDVRTKGWVEQEGELVFTEFEDDSSDDDDDDGRLYQSEVVVQRRGDGRFPIEVLMVFEDDSEVRHSWDGQARWTAFVEERSSKLDYAVVDPDRKLMLDTHVINNSMVRKSRAGLPALKWSSKWNLWLQDMLTSFAFFF